MVRLYDWAKHLGNTLFREFGGETWTDMWTLIESKEPEFTVQGWKTKASTAVSVTMACHVGGRVYDRL